MCSLTDEQYCLRSTTMPYLGLYSSENKTTLDIIKTTVLDDKWQMKKTMIMTNDKDIQRTTSKSNPHVHSWGPFNSIQKGQPDHSLFVILFKDSSKNPPLPVWQLIRRRQVPEIPNLADMTGWQLVFKQTRVHYCCS